MLYRFLGVQYLVILLPGMLLFLIDAVQPFRQKKAFRAAVSELWQREHWIGTEREKEYRKTAGEWCFTAAAVLYVVWYLFSNSCLALPDAVLYWMYEGCLMLALVKILFLSRYAYGRLFMVIMCMLPLLAAAHISRNFVFLAAFLLFFAAKDVNLKRTLRICMAPVGIGLALLAVLSILKVIPMDGTGTAQMAEAEHRYALGTIYPNTTGVLILFLLSGWYVLRYRNWKAADWIIAAVGFSIIAFVNKSRAPMIAAIAVFALGEAMRYLPRITEFAPVRAVMTAAPAAAAALSFLLGRGYSSGGPLLEKLNALLSGRLYLFSEAIKAFHVTWFGQNIRTDIVYTLDNTYLYLFYRMGILCFALYLAGMTVLIWKLLRTKNRPMLAVAIGFVLYGLMECIAMWPNINISVWLLPALLWGIPLEKSTLS